MNVVNITDICDIQVGKTPSRSNPSYWGDGSLWLSIADMNQGPFLESTKETITEKAIKDCGCKLIPQNTVLFSFKLSIGKVGITKKPMYTNEAIAAFIIKDHSKIDTKYLFYVLKSVDHSVGANKAVMGNTLNKEKLKKIKILLPSLEAQKQIVEILEKADSLRQKRKQSIKLLDEYLKAIFLDMFGDPVNNTKGWDVKRLKDISTKILSGNTPKGGAQVYVKDGVLFLRSQNVWRNKLDLDDVAFISEEIHNKMKNSSLEHKDLVMTKTGRINTENSSLGRAAIYLGENNRANINGHVYLIRLKKDAVHEFVLFILTTNEYREYIRRICVGGIDKRQINKVHLEEFPIIFPPIELQNKFVKIVQETESLKQKMIIQEEQLKNQFHALMQKTFH